VEAEVLAASDEEEEEVPEKPLEEFVEGDVLPTRIVQGANTSLRELYIS
jgi:hypothetical protein